MGRWKEKPLKEKENREKGVLVRLGECFKEKMIIWAVDGARKNATEN